MRWRSSRRSRNVDDQRGRSPMGMGRRGGMKIGGLGIIILFVVGLLLGQDPMQLLGQVTGGGGSPAPQQQTSGKVGEDEGAQFVSTVLASNEDTWNKLLPQQAGKNYREPRLTLFSRTVRSACGMASSASGPFYCPADHRIYIDLSFFGELRRLGAPGDFAQAYVIGHEVGHHVQNLLGVSSEVTRLQQRVSKRDANRLSVLTELQADCYAGVWAHHSEKEKRWLDEGDIDEGIRAASSIGDDRMQSSAGQYINPDAFTHGSSEQRKHWLIMGLRYGDMNRCDTFKGLK